MVNRYISDVRANLQDFECSVCKAGINKPDDSDLRIGNVMSFERVETFCYLGDMLSSDGGYEHAVITRDKTWNKFRELKLLWCAKRISLNVKRESL